MRKLKQKIQSFTVRVNIMLGIISAYLHIRPFQKVNTFIVGTQKGGTSALYYYLEKSPEVSGGYKKEIGFFSQEHTSKLGKDWYERQFATFKKKPKILLDATPEYLYYPSVPERIYKYNPDAKIIILLRNPVMRAYSHYNMFKQLHNLPASKKNKLIKRFWSSSSANPMITLLTKKKFQTLLIYSNRKKKLQIM